MSSRFDGLIFCFRVQSSDTHFKQQPSFRVIDGIGRYWRVLETIMIIFFRFDGLAFQFRVQRSDKCFNGCRVWTILADIESYCWLSRVIAG